MKSGFEKRISRAKAPLSAALVLLLLLLQTLSASAALHEDVHADAHHSDHECAVSLLSNGQIDVSEGGLTLPVAPAFAELRLLLPAPADSTAVAGLPSSRGPPSHS
jgi:hypothetical protein